MIRHLRIAATEISRENELIKHGISRVVLVYGSILADTFAPPRLCVRLSSLNDVPTPRCARARLSSDAAVFGQVEQVAAGLAEDHAVHAQRVDQIGGDCVEAAAARFTFELRHGVRALRLDR